MHKLIADVYCINQKEKRELYWCWHQICLRIAHANRGIVFKKCNIIGQALVCCVSHKPSKLTHAHKAVCSFEHQIPNAHIIYASHVQQKEKKMISTVYYIICVMRRSFAESGKM